ncbi:MAG: AbrB/MazE/SpoVT family DNA-binding domain-containing protein [bacterium]|nr:AbrB/MazE/SpoVT family DNA-binding domain-containing protein [bacterium]
MINFKEEKTFYGTAPLGEKGQVVVPAEARRVMGLKKGEKLLVFGMGHEMLVFAKASNIEKMLSHIAIRLKSIQKIQKSIKISKK